MNSRRSSTWSEGEWSRKTPRNHSELWKTLRQERHQGALEAFFSIEGTTLWRSPAAIRAVRREPVPEIGPSESYSTSEGWRVGGIEGVEGKRISTPLPVK